MRSQRSVVAAASAFALAVVLFSDGARTMFTPTLSAPSMTPQMQVVYSSPEGYAVPFAQTPPLQPIMAEHETSGWSNIAMLAVVGAVAGVAAAAVKGKTQQMAVAPDLESATATQLAGPIAALAVMGGETPADLQALAKKLNPAVGFYDPLGLADGEFWEQPNVATIGFLRHAEIKHGRVAMAGFVGFCVHANGIHFPWKVPGDEMCAAGVSPPLLWQNIPEEAKWQIILTLGLFEIYSEAAVAKVPGFGGHYMRGGKPGFFPPLVVPKGSDIPSERGGIPADEEGNALLPHPVPLNLYDPFGFNKKKSDEWKAEKLNVEINNGRLAMIGLMGFLAEGAVPGSVPLLTGVVPSSGEINVMSPFDMTLPLFG
jgi:hypothetical protein